MKDIYCRMIKQIKWLQYQYPDFCRYVFSNVIVVYCLLYLQEFHVLFGLYIQAQNVNQFIISIVKIYSLFLIIWDDNVYIIHQSAKNFLTKKTNHDIFFYGIEDIYHSILLNSVENLSRILWQDIYGLYILGTNIKQMKPQNPDSLMMLYYLYIYWTDHFCDWNTSIINDQFDLPDKDKLDSFLRKKYLYWFETLSLYRSIPKRMLVIAKLEIFV